MKRFAKLLAAVGAAAVMVLAALGTVRYSTLLETIMTDPLVYEWHGPAELRIGERGAWEKVDIPRIYLKDRFAAAKPGERAQYRFVVEIPPALRAQGEAVAFSPNWVVHRSYDISVDGAWVASGHGVTASGDIVYQKVVVSLPSKAVAAGRAVVVVDAEIGPADLGIQHLGKIVVGPAVALGRMHVEAEYGMGSYYLLFLTAEGAVFVFFALVYLLARTRRGFGAFVGYAFLMTVIHLAIGNFFEGALPFSVRIWLYFGAKGGAATLLAVVLGAFLWRDRPPRVWLAFAGMPALIAFVMLANMSFGPRMPTIASMHDIANWSLLAVVALFFVVACRRLVTGKLSVGPVAFGGLYLGFLIWNFFVHATHDFDYRPLADLAFFYFVAWMTLSEFGVVQAEARIRAANLRRITALFARLTGRQTATHLVIRGDDKERQSKDVAVLVFDLRYTDRMMRRLGVAGALTVVDEFVRHASEAVEANGGEIHKIMGDKLLVVFGMTVALDDVAGRAARAALDLRQRMGEWNVARTRDGEPLLGWAGGLAAGSVIVGRIGAGERTDYGVFGPTVGRAFHLAGRAKEQAVDLAIDQEIHGRLAERAVVQRLEGRIDDDAYAFLGLVENGVVQFADARWQRRYAGVGASTVYEAGGNQDAFIPEEEGERDAA